MLSLICPAIFAKIKIKINAFHATLLNFIWKLLCCQMFLFIVFLKIKVLEKVMQTTSARCHSFKFSFKSLLEKIVAELSCLELVIFWGSAYWNCISWKTISNQVQSPFIIHECHPKSFILDSTFYQQQLHLNLFCNFFPFITKIYKYYISLLMAGIFYLSVYYEIEYQEKT